MDEDGITITEACARAAQGSGYLTDEDFASQCNPDGSVKQANAVTTFSLKHSDSSVTVDNTHLLIGAAVGTVAVILVIVLIVRKIKRKSAA